MVEYLKNLDTKNLRKILDNIFGFELKCNVYTKEILSWQKQKKYYAVRKGFVPGIYTSWGECQQNINGFSGAEHKGFSTKEEAEAFLNNTDLSEDDTIKRIYSSSDAVAYVAGCFNTSTNEYSYGVVIIYDGGEEHLSQKFNDSDMATMRNIAGEIEGTKRAIRFCVDTKIKSVDIFYDYEGIKEWCTGAWKANKPGTKEYKKYYNSVIDLLKITFVKGEGYSENAYDDLADSLAKAAVGLGEPQTNISVRNNGIIANGIKKDDLEGVFDLLKEDFSDLKLSNREIPYATQYELEISIPNRQKLTVNLYEQKKKIWINGRQEDLFNRLTLYLVELLEIDEIPDFLNTIHETNIDKDVVESEFVNLFPNSYNKLPDDLSRYLHQAVFNLHVSTNVYVANYLVEPAIRPLEGILKMALKNNNIPIRKEDNDYDSFFVFKEKNGAYRLKEQFVTESHSKDLLDYLSKCYTYYHDNRHTLFHWDDPTKEKDTTRILNSIEEAVPIIRDAIALIDEYYTIN